MKKVLILILSVFMMFTIGCSKGVKPPYHKTSYTSETAIKNGDIVNIHGKRYNAEKFEMFIENVQKGTKDKVRITQYTIEGDPIITDLEFGGKKIKYTFDNTRDAFGVPVIEKKEFNTDSLYKSGSNYYLKDTPEDILIY